MPIASEPSISLDAAKLRGPSGISQPSTKDKNFEVQRALGAILK